MIIECLSCAISGRSRTIPRTHRSSANSAPRSLLKMMVLLSAGASASDVFDRALVNQSHRKALLIHFSKAVVGEVPHIQDYRDRADETRRNNLQLGSQREVHRNFGRAMQIVGNGLVANHNHHVDQIAFVPTRIKKSLQDSRICMAAI